MKKYLMTVMLLLGTPLLTFGQEQVRKPTASPAGNKAQQPRSPQPSKAPRDDEASTEVKLGQPKRVSAQAFIDLLNKGRGMVENGEIDLSSPIEMEVSADRGRNGTLRNIGINQKVIAAPQRELAREFIEALSSSGALGFLDGVRHIVFTLRLNETTLSLSASSELPSAKNAGQLAKAGTLLIEVGASVKRGRDEEILYQGANVSASGKRVTVSLSLPRDTVAGLLSKRLQSGSGQ